MCIAQEYVLVEVYRRKLRALHYHKTSSFAV
jgi:hypothetical protein